MATELLSDSDYIAALEAIKAEIAQTRARAVLAVNHELVCMYWRIGHMLDARAKWGNKFIETLSRDIRSAYPDIKGFSVRSLRYMLRFAREFDYEFVQQLVAQIPWGHIVHLMDKVPDPNQRTWYIAQATEHGWSRAVLMHQISIKLYERQVETGKVTNFDKLLPPDDSEMIQQALKDPYIFDFITTQSDVAEREMEDEMMKNVTKLLLELGEGFAFMGRQYHLVISGKDFYIDLLFYNTKLRRHIVIELKATEFKPEYTGKLGFYVSAVDDLLRNEGDKPAHSRTFALQNKGQRHCRVLAAQLISAHRGERVSNRPRAARRNARHPANARRDPQQNLGAAVFQSAQTRRAKTSSKNQGSAPHHAASDSSLMDDRSARR